MHNTFVLNTGFDPQWFVLQQVLTWVRENKLLQPSKCSSCVERVVCLSHGLNTDGMADKVAAIMALPLSDSVRALKGQPCVGHGRSVAQVIENYARSASPSEKKTHRTVLLEWTAECETAECEAGVESLKQALCFGPMLAVLR